MKTECRLVLAVAMSLGLGVANAESGHCTYVQQAQRGSFEVCEMPVGAETCSAIGAQAEHGGGSCPTADVVGICDKGATKILYYEGDAPGLEIGCGMQGGTWINSGS